MMLSKNKSEEDFEEDFGLDKFFTARDKFSKLNNKGEILGQFINQIFKKCHQLFFWG